MLDYPFNQNESPEAGSLKQVAEGVYWLRMELPFALDHINLWLLEDDNGWTLVDTGFNNSSSRDTWDRVIDQYLNGMPIKRVIVTHMHPDHIGLAGWLTRRFECELSMSRSEFVLCNALINNSEEAREIASKFYQAAGYSSEQLATYQNYFGNFSKMVSPLPESYCRLQEGESLTINGRNWQIVTGSGHSPEHVCLYCPELKLLISGDQVLPRISSNISLHPVEPEANPLADWLDSCKRLQKVLPADLLVLPSHQEPFYGLHHRLSLLIESHAETLDKLLAFLDKPNTAVACIPTMFKREIDGSLLQLATGETLAHLKYLLQQEQISRQRDDSGVDYYVRV